MSITITILTHAHSKTENKIIFLIKKDLTKKKKENIFSNNISILKRVRHLAKYQFYK